jgi:succinate dehydrogenase/fumarate reductase flavoprotein subunit
MMLKSWLPKKWDYAADVVIVGYGGAGAPAAIACHDKGVKALLLEKAPVGGGNMCCAGGGSTIPSDVDKGIQYYRALTAGMVDEDLIRTWAQSTHDLPHWLEELGAKLEYRDHEAMYPSFPGADAIKTFMHLARTPEQIKQGYWKTYGKDLFAFFDSQVKKRRIEVLYETPGKRLVQDPETKEILGVVAESAGKEIFVKATKGVILTCGGFENNKEMLNNFGSFVWELPLYPLGTPYNTGDGITMASEVGAKLWHMVALEFGNFAPKAPSEKLGVAVRLLRKMPKDSALIYINKYGKRFMNEMGPKPVGTLSHCKELFKVQHFDAEHAEFPNIPFYMVFDETFRLKGKMVEERSNWWHVQNMYQWSEDNSAEVEAGWFEKADTIEALAKKIKVPSEALEKTINAYNKACAQNEDEFGRGKDWLTPIKNPPFYASELCEPLINTQGGPKHNAKSQVLDWSDKPIPRLYAAGELGSVYYPLYQASGNLPEAMAFGKIAGEQAASLESWE